MSNFLGTGGGSRVRGTSGGISNSVSSVLGGKGGGDSDLGAFETGTLLSTAMGKSPAHNRHSHTLIAFIRLNCTLVQ